MSWLGLFLVALVVLVACGVGAGIMALLVNPKTRWAGVFLSVLGVVLLLASGVFFVRVYRDFGPGVTVVRLPSADPPARSVPPEQPMVIVELPPAASGQAPKKVNSVLRILANAVLKAIEEEERGDTPPKLAEKPEVTTVVAEPDAPPRPDWVDREPRLINGVYQMSVSAGPYLTLEECENKLPEELDKAVAEYVKPRHGLKASQRLHLPPDYIEGHLIQARFEERKQFSVGPMVRLHVLLGFDRQAAERIRGDWSRLLVQERIWGLSILGTLLLLLLSAVYGYLKVDLATEGRYRWRLRLAASVAIAAVIAVVLVFVRWS